MNLDEFLEENERYQYLILQWLDLKNESYTLNSEIVEFFGLSKFKLKQYLTNLQVDLSYIDTMASLEIQEGGRVHVQRLTTEVVKKIRLSYLKRSVYYQFFSEIFLNNGTVNDFCIKYNVGKSAAYEIRKSVNKKIFTSGIKISGNKVKGSEEDIRGLVFMLLHSFYNGLESPFDSKKGKVINNLINQLLFTLAISISNTQRIKIEIFLGVMLTRASLDVHFSNKILELTNGYFLLECPSTFRNLFNSKVRSDGEWSFLLLYLLAEDFTKDNDSFFILNGRIQQQATDLTLRVLGEFQKENKEFKIAQYEKHLTVEFQKSILRNCLFPAETNMRYRFKNIDFFTESYPFQSTVALRQAKILVKNLEGISVNVIQLYYDLLFIILDIIPIDKVEKPIHICVDFSQGKHYTNLIKYQIKGFKNLTIILEKNISAKTQLFVSDAPISGFSVEQIIWKSPPTPHDWEIFGNKVIEIKLKEVSYG